MTINLTKLCSAVSVAILAAIMSSSGVLADQLDDIKATGKLVVGIHADFPPFGYLDTSGKQQGLDSELAQRFADELGVKVEFKNVDNAARIPALQTGRIDILFAALTILPDRAKTVQFSIPYVASQSAILGPKDLAIKSGTDLAGISVGVPKGSAQDITLTKETKADILRFDGDAATQQALLSGQVKVIGQSLFVLPRLEEARPGQYEQKYVMTTLYDGIGIKLGEKGLADAANAFVAKLKENGELAKMHEKWTKLPLPTLPTEMEGISFTAK